MKQLIRLKHYWNRFRLLMNSEYYPEYLRKQGVQIGKQSTVIYPSYIDAGLPYLVEIGNNVIISRNVTILTHDATTAYAGDMVKIGKVIINDHSFIGANSTILCNICIGPGSIVGAGSVVTKDIPPFTIYSGNPARFICRTDDFIEKHRKLEHQLPFFKAKEFNNAYIKDKKKKFLKNCLSDTYGYLCSNLPKPRNGYPITNTNKGK